MNTEPTVLLAYLEGVGHVQIGRPRPYVEAHALYERMDQVISGFYHDARGRTQRDPSRIRPQFVGAHAVKFYRLRQVGHEFGNVPSYPVSAVKSTRTQEVTTMKSARKSRTAVTSKTPGGIKRPATGGFVTWEAARGAAKRANEAHGRGHRAIKAKSGGYTVIFRPSVASNKQRKVRALSPTV